MKKSAIALREIESWLANYYPMTHHFSEQTILAALATKFGVELMPDNYSTGPAREEDARIIHYCGHKLSQTRINMRRRGQKIALNILRDHQN